MAGLFSEGLNVFFCGGGGGGGGGAAYYPRFICKKGYSAACASDLRIVIWSRARLRDVLKHGSTLSYNKPCIANTGIDKCK